MPESVWDYPRPPALVPCERQVRVEHRGVAVADSTRALRVLETASPPTIYVPEADVRTDLLRPSAARSTVCEWKGRAVYWSVRDHEGHWREAAGWSYPEPTPAFASIAGWLSFYPARLQCTVAGEPVRPQPGGFYGGWLTDEIVGPVKGAPGTGHC